MPKPLTLAYFGLPLGAYLLTLDGHRLDPCVLSPIDAVGRRRVVRSLGDAVIEASELVPAELEAAVSKALSEAKPELLVSWFWTRLLPERWLTSCPRGAIGVHPSLLPRHRGPDPFFWAIDAGDELTGVTLHTLSAQYDRGGILSQQSLAVGTQSAWQLARALDRPSLVALREGVRAIAEGRPPRAEPQDEAFASWAPEPTGELLRVDFHWPTERALRRIRALSPVPGLALEIRGVAFSVIAAERSERVLNALEPGEAGVLSDPPTLIIRTADGAIAIHRAQLSGEETETIDGAALAELIASKPAREP